MSNKESEWAAFHRWWGSPLNQEDHQFATDVWDGNQDKLSAALGFKAGIRYAMPYYPDIIKELPDGAKIQVLLEGELAVRILTVKEGTGGARYFQEESWIDWQEIVWMKIL